MAEEQAKSGESKDEGSSTSVPRSAWVDLLKEAGQNLIPLVVSTGSLLGFVAFGGAVVVWTRLSAVEIASDQAITAFPRGELVAIGSSLLLVFGFFGALAVLGAFLVDRGGRPTQGMARALLGLLSIEGVAAILLASGHGPQEKAIALLLFLFPASFALWAISFERFSELSDELHSRIHETKEPVRRESILRLEEFEADQMPEEDGNAQGGESPGLLMRIWHRLVAALGLGAAPAPPAPPAPSRGRLWDWAIGFACDHRRLVVKRLPAICLSFGAATLAVLILLDVSNDWMLWAAVAVSIPFWLLLAFGWAVDAKQVSETLKQEQRGDREEAEGLAAQEEEALKGLEALSEGKAKEAKQLKRRALEDRRLSGRRPFRLVFNGFGLLFVVGSLALAAALPAWRLGEVWLGAALAAAAVIVMWLWRVAIFTRDKVVWFGLAVFLSVPLFGTLMGMARNLDDPQIQPVALIRSSDGPDEAIHGLYVTEAEKRVYFATVGMERCSGRVLPDSGRLLWVPKSEVVAMSVGPSQSVESAARTSLEMAFALTPAVETPAGDSVSLKPREAGPAAGGQGGEGQPRKQRLESAGPAVRPTFGSGLSLEPEDALPGETVTLRMSNPSGEGFGAVREGRTVRVGGVPAKLARYPTSDASRAEYAVAVDGRFIILDKQGVYVKEDGQMVRSEDASDPGKGNRYVRVDDTKVAAEDDTGVGVYLKLEHASVGGAGATADVIAEGERISFKDSKPVALQPTLRRQAWNKDEIKFVVPERGSTGAVTVDCEQLSGQPLLRVDERPRARCTAQMTGPERISLDSTRSADDGMIVARRWSSNGSPVGSGMSGEGAGASGKRAPELRLERNLAINHLRLVVEDDAGEIDTAAIFAIRLPKPSIAAREVVPKSLRRLGTAVERAARSEAPVAIESHGHARSSSRSKATTKSLRRATQVAHRLLTKDAARSGELKSPVAVKVKAFGSECRGAVRRRAHVDVFVMTDGVRLLGPAGCHARSVKDPMVWSRQGLRAVLADSP